MQIQQRTIGDDQPPYIIAEIGVNHDGDLDRCIALTCLARDAGADAVKFQLFEADLLMSGASRLATYQREAGESDPREMLRRLQLSVEQLGHAADQARRLGVHAIISVFSVDLVARAESVGFDAYKTASPDIVHKPLLDALRATGKPLIVSTGAATLAEVTRAITWLTREGQHARAARDLALLQCVSSYPTPMEKAAFGGIMALRDIFPGPVGYSDHTAEDAAGALAVACGACILEKHFTDDRARIGPDHRASLDPRGFAMYVERARRAWELLRGDVRDESRDGTRAASRELAALMAHASKVRKEKLVLEIEQDVRAVSRQSIVTRRGLPEGSTLRREDLTFKRPGTGLLPFEIERVLGRRLSRALDADTPLGEGDLAS